MVHTAEVSKADRTEAEYMDSYAVAFRRVQRASDETDEIEVADGAVEGLAGLRGAAD